MAYLPQVLDAFFDVQAASSATFSTLADEAATCCCLESFEALVMARQQTLGQEIAKIFTRIMARSYES